MPAPAERDATDTHEFPSTGNKKARGPEARALKRQGKAEKNERNADIWQLWISGLTEWQIAQKIGLTRGATHRILTDIKQTMAESEPTVADFRQLVVYGTLDVIRHMTERMHAEPLPAYSNGKPILDSDGEQTVDYSLQLGAADRLLKAHERLAKITGVEAPSEHAITVTLQAQSSAEIAAAEALARIEAARAVGISPPAEIEATVVEVETELAAYRTPAGPCCDLHNANCYDIEETCCHHCPGWLDSTSNPLRDSTGRTAQPDVQMSGQEDWT